jgi:hypothetical protein
MDTNVNVLEYKVKKDFTAKQTQYYEARSDFLAAHMRCCAKAYGAGGGGFDE